MKFKLIVSSFILSLFLVGTAFAVPYSVNFDPDGTGTDFDATEIWGFDTEGIAQYSIGGATTTTTTYIEQDLGADKKLGNDDTFTEKFTTVVTNGTDSDGNRETNFYSWDLGLDTIDTSNLKIDINLSGYIFGYDDGGTVTTRDDYVNILDDSYFTQMTAGDAVMYIDMNGDNSYNNTGDVWAADFGFSNAAASFLADTVWPGGAGTANYSVAFSLDDYSTDFWSDASFGTSLADLVADGFVMTYNDGSAKALGVEGADTSPENTILLGFSDNGIDVVFGAVPEPTTMLLFGVGLLGIAGVSRRKGLK